MSDIKTLKQYYIDNPCSLNVENYIAQLEQQNKEMLYILIVELKNDWMPWNSIGGSLDVFKIDHAYKIFVIEKITGKKIDEVLK